MKAILKYILLTAARDWLFIGLLAALTLVSGVSAFLGSTALSEQNSMQLAFISGSSRLVLVVGMILFICFHIRRSFENREIEFLISRPISRSVFIVAYFVSFTVLSFILLLPVAALIQLMFAPDNAGFFVWFVSIFCELVIISSFAVLASLILKSAVSAVLGCFAFYFISRIIGFAVSTIIIPAKINNLGFNGFLEIFLKGLSAILPRLDQFGQSKWLIYGDVSTGTYHFIVSQAIIYVALILLMSIYDFNKKQF